MEYGFERLQDVVLSSSTQGHAYVVRGYVLSEMLHAPRLGGIAPSAHFLICRYQLPGWEAHSDLLLLRLCLFAADQVALLACIFKENWLSDNQEASP